MAAPHKLSATEVAALVDGLRSLEAETGQADGVEVRPYRFGADSGALLGDHYGLRMINERFCRLARGVFLPFLRIQPRISSFPPEIKPFGAFSDGLDNFVSLTISRMEPLRGQQMIVIHPDFVSLLTEAYYGGAIRSHTNRRGEFTTTELRVIEIICAGLNRAQEAAWRDVAHLTFTPQSHEENLQFATFVDADDLVVNCSFIIELPGADPANLDILYPLQALKPLAAQLRSRMQSDLVDEDLSWKKRLEAALRQVPVTLVAKLAEPDVSLAEVTALTPGRVVVADVQFSPMLLIEDQPLFTCEIGEKAGRAAVSLGRAFSPKPRED